MKREYQSGYRKLYADKAFKQRLVQNLEDYRIHPNPVRPRWMAPVAVAACLILLFGLGMPTMQRILYQEGTTSGLSVPGDEGVTITNGVYSDKQVTNLLVWGTDSENGYDDFVMLLSLDRRRGALKCSSFQSDLAVTLPEGGQQKLGRLSRKLASPDLAVTTIEKNFGVGVDGYIQASMSDFPKIIDAIGGVTMELSEQEAVYFALSSALEIGLPGLDAGTYELSGAQALYYLRMRQGDEYDQMQRREKLLQTLVEQAKNGYLAELSNAVLSVAKTDFTVSQTTDLLLELPDYLGNPVQSLMLPADRTEEAISLKDCGQALAKFLYEVIPDNSGAYIAPATQPGGTLDSVPGNLANGGIAAQGDGVYYIDYSENGNLYMQHSGNRAPVELTQFPCSALNVQGEYLYFISQRDGGVYRMDGDGENLLPVVVGTERQENLVVTPEYLYYSRGNTIYRMKTDIVDTSYYMNSIPEEFFFELNSGSLLDLQWSNGAVYAFASIPEFSKQINVYRLDTKSGPDSVCAFNRSTSGSSFFHWDGSALYYTNDDGLNRWEDGKSVRIVPGTIMSVLAVDDTIFWQDNFGTLYRAEWDGTGLVHKEDLMRSSYMISRLCIVGDSLFYTDSTKSVTWRMDLNNSNRTEMMRGSMASYGAVLTESGASGSSKVGIKETENEGAKGYTTLDGIVVSEA